MIYLIGSLRNPEVPRIAKRMRECGIDIFDDWYAAGPHADDCWRDYEKAKGLSFVQALSGAAAKNVFDFDKRHLDASEACVLVCPAGKSGHLELGYMLGKGKPGFVLLEPGVDRWDVMYQFATAVFDDTDRLIRRVHRQEVP